jgi:ParB-like chromosome segregation protein Spo0J
MSKPIVLHPVVDLFPPMTEPEFQELKESIREHGLKTVITFWRGQLIDGRHRVRAMQEFAYKR